MTPTVSIRLRALNTTTIRQIKKTEPIMAPYRQTNRSIERSHDIHLREKGTSDHSFNKDNRNASKSIRINLFHLSNTRQLTGVMTISDKESSKRREIAVGMLTFCQQGPMEIAAFDNCHRGCMLWEKRNNE